MKRKYLHRILSMILVVTLIATSLPLGYKVQKNVPKVKAAFVVDDALVYGSAVILTLIISGTAAGIPLEDIVSNTSDMGWSSVEDAIADYTAFITNDDSIEKVFDITEVEKVEFATAIAKASYNSEYCIEKDVLELMFQSFEILDIVGVGETEGTSAKALDYTGLAEGVKAAIIPFPNNNDNDDDNDGDSSSSSSSPVLSRGSVAGLMGTSLFTVSFALFKAYMTNKTQTELSTETNETTFDYSGVDWLSEPQILEICSDEFGKNTNTISSFFMKFYSAKIQNNTTPLNLENFQTSKIYPITYLNSNGDLMCRIVMSNPMDSYLLDYIYFGADIVEWSNMSYELDFFNYSPATINYNLDTTIDIANTQTAIQSDVDNAELFKQFYLKGMKFNNINKTFYVTTEENADEFQKIVESQVYTHADLLDFLADGWKGKIDSSWKGIQDKGETAKKVMESEKGDKYVTPGKGIDTDGNEVSKPGVSVGSLVEGIVSVGSGSTQVGSREFLGDETKDTPIEYPQPGQELNPDAEPDINPDTGTETNPDTGTETNPGTGTETNPGTGTETNPGTGTETNPGTGTETNPGTETETNPDTETETVSNPDKSTLSEIQFLNKFPFCVPFDLVALIQSLSAESKAPKWTLPFTIERLGIEEKIVVDFAKYESVAVISRWFFRLIFIMSLVIITRALIKG